LISDGIADLLCAMNILDLTPNQLKRAAAIKEQIESLSRELSAILGGSAKSAPASNKRRRTMSAAVKKKIAAAQRARWANLRRAKSGNSAAKSKKAGASAK
jgi:phage gpG-like protein